MIFCSVLFFSFCVYAKDNENNAVVSNDQEVIAQFEISKYGENIFLPVMFNGKEHLFVMDTGATYTLFDHSHRDYLGDVKRTVKGLTMGRPIKTEIYDAPDAFVGPISLDSEEVCCVDLSLMSLIEGRKICGIVGVDFLKKHIIKLDYDKGTLSFLKPDSVTKADLGHEFSIDFFKGIPQLKINVVGIRYSAFIIDTGTNSALTLERGLFNPGFPK